jgi:hypothetical protein
MMGGKNFTATPASSTLSLQRRGRKEQLKEEVGS